MTLRAAGQPPDPVDIYVGARIRMRRQEIDISQQALAAGIGVTFQQVQKYERGGNRISASMLVRVSNTLDVPPGYFFDGAPGTSTDRQIEGNGTVSLTELVHLASQPGTMTILRALAKMPYTTRTHFLEFANACHSPEPAQDQAAQGPAAAADPG